MPSALPKSSPALYLLAAGVFTCTWDLTLTHDVGGFTLKAYQGFFLLAALWLLWEQRAEGLRGYLAPLQRPFAAALLALAAYDLGLAPWSAFPLKSFLYACWLLFDLTVVWLVFQHLARRFPLECFYRIFWATLGALSAVVLVDQVAYQFGHTSGFLGHNQDALLQWGISRPHAFSSEPSYLAAFLSLGLITVAKPIYHLSRRKIFFWPILLLVIFADVSTTSRTGWFSLIIGFTLLTTLPLFAGQKIHPRPVLAFLGLLLVALALFYATTPARQRQVMNNALVSGMVTGEDGSGWARLRAHRFALQWARETHGLGTGLGASYRYYIEHGGKDPNAPKDRPPRYGSEVIMSTWGQVLAESGVPGFLLYLVAAGAMLRALWRGRNADRGEFAPSAFAAACVFFVFTAFWLGNLCRGDVWVWYGLWGITAYQSGNQEYRRPCV